MISDNFLIYLLCMAGVTYLVRMLPMVIFKKKIQNKYLLSFLHYIPYTVLSAMTIPAIFYAANPIPALVGFIIAVCVALFNKGLVQVAAFSCVGVLITELIIKHLI